MCLDPHVPGVWNLLWNIWKYLWEKGTLLLRFHPGRKHGCNLHSHFVKFLSSKQTLRKHGSVSRYRRPVSVNLTHVKRPVPHGRWSGKRKLTRRVGSSRDTGKRDSSGHRAASSGQHPATHRHRIKALKNDHRLYPVHRQDDTVSSSVGLARPLPITVRHCTLFICT